MRKDHTCKLPRQISNTWKFTVLAMGMGWFTLQIVGYLPNYTGIFTSRVNRLNCVKDFVISASYFILCFYMFLGLTWPNGSLLTIFVVIKYSLVYPSHIFLRQKLIAFYTFDVIGEILLYILGLNGGSLKIAAWIRIIAA